MLEQDALSSYHCGFDGRRKRRERDDDGEKNDKLLLVVACQTAIFFKTVGLAGWRKMANIEANLRRSTDLVDLFSREETQEFEQGSC